MRRWTFSYERACVFSVECERYGYPHQDEHGNCQFENTHFDTEKEALEYLHKEAKACVFLCARSRDEEQLLSCAMQLAGLQGRNRTGVIQRLARVEAKILQTIDERRNA